MHSILRKYRAIQIINFIFCYFGKIMSFKEFTQFIYTVEYVG